MDEHSSYICRGFNLETNLDAPTLDARQPEPHGIPRILDLPFVLTDGRLERRIADNSEHFCVFLAARTTSTRPESICCVRSLL